MLYEGKPLNFMEGFSCVDVAKSYLQCQDLLSPDGPTLKHSLFSPGGVRPKVAERGKQPQNKTRR